jgi:hypothetical protein
LKIELFIVASKHILTLQFYKSINNFRIESNENIELRISLREMKRYVNSMTLNNQFCLFGKLQLDYPDEIINNTGFPLEFIPYLIRGGKDMYFQSVTSLSVIPAKAGIQKLINNWSIPNKRIINFTLI